AGGVLQACSGGRVGGAVGADRRRVERDRDGRRRPELGEGGRPATGTRRGGDRLLVSCRRCRDGGRRLAVEARRCRRRTEGHISIGRERDELTGQRAPGHVGDGGSGGRVGGAVGRNGGRVQLERDIDGGRLHGRRH